MKGVQFATLLMLKRYLQLWTMHWVIPTLQLHVVVYLMPLPWLLFCDRTNKRQRGISGYANIHNTASQRANGIWSNKNFPSWTVAPQEDWGCWGPRSVLMYQWVPAKRWDIAWRFQGRANEYFNFARRQTKKLKSNTITKICKKESMASVWHLRIATMSVSTAKKSRWNRNRTYRKAKNV